MAFIRTIPPAQAAGEVRAMYEQAQQSSGHVPNFVKAFTLRPNVWNAYSPLIRTIRGNMDLRRYELVATAVALAVESSYCSLAHGQVLRDKILGPEQTVAFAHDFQQSELAPAEKAMVAFARKIALRARSITQQNIEELRTHGFSDTDLFDIAAAAAARCFFTKILDAVGAQPDAFYAQMEPALQQALVVGRDIEKDGAE